MIFKKNNIGVVVQLVRAPACHAGSCEFESRPPRTNPQESNLEGFSLHVTPRQITQALYASVINQKQEKLPIKNVLKPVHSDRIGDNSPQKRSIK